MSSRLHQWIDGVCRHCGVNVLDVHVNGGLFCAGSPEARGGNDTEPQQNTGPSAAGMGSSGGFIPPTPQAQPPTSPPPTGPYAGTAPTPQHDWDAAGFCKLCKLGMYAVKQLNLPCRPVPAGAPGAALPLAAYGGHTFWARGPKIGTCISCGYHQASLTHFDCDCATAQIQGVPPMPGPAQPYPGYPQVAPFTPDVAQDSPSKSPYLIQWSDAGDPSLWPDVLGQCWVKQSYNPLTGKIESVLVEQPQVYEFVQDAEKANAIRWSPELFETDD